MALKEGMGKEALTGLTQFKLHSLIQQLLHVIPQLLHVIPHHLHDIPIIQIKVIKSKMVVMLRGL